MERSIPGTWAAGILAHAANTGSQNRWSTTLSVLDNLVGTPGFYRVAFQSNLSKQGVCDLVMQVVGDLLQPDEQNLIKLLTKHGRLRMISKIRRRYEELRDREAGISRVLLITAIPMEPSAYEHMLPALHRRFGQRMKPHFHLDPDLMGGVVIRCGDQVLDVSAKTRLARLSRTLKD